MREQASLFQLGPFRWNLEREFNKNISNSKVQRWFVFIFFFFWSSHRNEVSVGFHISLGEPRSVELVLLFSLSYVDHWVFHKTLYCGMKLHISVHPKLIKVICKLCIHSGWCDMKCCLWQESSLQRFCSWLPSQFIISAALIRLFIGPL